MYNIFWLVVFLVFLIAEIISLGLTTIWFAVGALVAFLFSMLGLPLSFQIIAFFVESIFLLIITRPVMAKYLNEKTIKTNAESLIGCLARVVTPVDNIKGEGCVIINGMEWTARSTKDEVTFQKDEIVRIAGISGVKLIVEK